MSGAPIDEERLKNSVSAFEEIYAQGRRCHITWERAEERRQRFHSLLPLTAYTDIIFTGCGSSLHLARCAAAGWSELLGQSVRAVPASELLHFPHLYLRPEAHPLIVALSRTGGTTEVIRAVARVRQQYGAATAGMTSEPDGQLRGVCDVDLVFSECQEHSVVMTGAFTAMLYGLLLLADGIAGRKQAQDLARVPDLLSQAMAQSEPICRNFAAENELKQFIFLGSGPLLGLAHESALKLTEMALESATAYPTLEFRHGPIAALDSHSLVIMTPVEAEVPYLEALTREIAATGSELLVVSDAPLALVARQLSFESGLREIFRPLLFAQVGQLLGLWRAVKRGLNPDAPPHLRRTVTLETSGDIPNKFDPVNVTTHGRGHRVRSVRPTDEHGP